MEIGPGGRGDRCFQLRLVDHEMLCQSSKVSDSLLPVTGKMTDGEDGDNHPIVEYPAIFSIILGLLEDFLSLLPARADLVILSTYKKFIMKQGVLELIFAAHLRESFTSQGFSIAASDLLLSS